MLSRLAATLQQHGGLSVFEHVPLARYTRFELGGPAEIVIDASTEAALAEAVRAVAETRRSSAVIGGGTNLIAADEGFPGAVLRYTNPQIEIAGARVHAAAGVVLQDLVDATISHGLRGLETMTGIPGWVGGAVYGNAGAYGRSLQESVESVRFHDGARVHEIGNQACQFRYRESVFKRHKDWIILSATLKLDAADPQELGATADGILKIRNAKYPPSMRCAGSIFKNLLWDQLPESVRSRVPENVVREGKVPSAYFLEQAGAKGMQRGGIRVADYHANLLYNAGGGTALQARELIAELKRRVSGQFGVQLEEEVQYL
ncbi:MAG: UDP-N-acetylmuramate dehydrogenase [Bryobacterales bacterium]|nr:UDP-N-acetylmuramate dehydrogenase [Bryobacterales bacterium]